VFMLGFQREGGFVRVADLEYIYFLSRDGGGKICEGYP
jgi:hypothetical protein